MSYLKFMAAMILAVASHGVMADTAINLVQFAFSPTTVTVPIGEKVTWTNNQDGVTHSVVSDQNVFSSPPLKPGEAFSYTFTSAGTYAYHCGYHSYMTGSITVK